MRSFFLAAVFSLFLLPSAAAKPFVAGATVCFNSKGAAGLVAGSVSALGCHSSSCTRALERSFSVRVDAKTGVIRATARFVLQRLKRGACTADCGGGGRITFDMRFFPRRTYQVVVNGKPAGTLDLRDGQARACFGQRR